jgi:hypothetical protein
VTIRSRVAGWTYGLLTLAARSPWLAISLARVARYGNPIRKDTEILIEGFSRSGNSFAVAAFRRAQERHVRIAHHLHAPGHVVAATKAGIPVLVVIRDPDEAVPEFALSKPNLSVRSVLRGYVRFYEPLVSLTSDFVIASFAQVTTGFGEVIARINQQFGTEFRSFQASDVNLRAAHEDVARDYLRRRGKGPAILGSVATASEGELNTLRGRILNDYRQPELDESRGRARRLYEELLAAP